MPHIAGHNEGLKGWLEENISKKGLSRAYKKASAYQAGEMSKDVIPGLSQGDLYGMVTGGTTGKASSLKGIYKAGKSMFSKWKGGKPVSSTISDVTKSVSGTPLGQSPGSIKVNPQKLSTTFQEAGQTVKRDIVTVSVRGEKGQKMIQPFYKSSGTSGGSEALSARRGRYMPFLGTGKGGYGSIFHKGRMTLGGSPSSHLLRGGKYGQYSTAKGVKISGGINPAQDLSIRLGGELSPTAGAIRMSRTSDILGKMEKGGLLKTEKMTSRVSDINPWLKEKGFTSFQ